MSVLTISPEQGALSPQVIDDPLQISAELGQYGVLFEQWRTEHPLAQSASQEQVITAYRSEVNRLMKRYHLQSVDVISLGADHPEKVTLRNQFLGEHTHSEHEVRFFVEGGGLFYLHTKGQVFGLMCEAGDLINIPKGMPHWFDMGESPEFKCIRLFTNQEGWVAEYTDTSIVVSFPSFERFKAHYQ